MPWFVTPVTIYISCEAEDAADARFHAETIMDKRVVGQEYGYNENDRGEVCSDYEMGETRSQEDIDPPICNSCHEVIKTQDGRGSCPKCDTYIRYCYEDKEWYDVMPEEEECPGCGGKCEDEHA